MSAAPPSAIRHAPPGKLADLYVELECPISDAVRSVKVLEIIEEEILAVPSSLLKQEGYKFFMLTQDQLDAWSFAFHEHGDRLRRLLEKWESDWEEAKRCA